LKYNLGIYFFATTVSVLIGWYSFKKGSVSWSGLAALVTISTGIIWLDEIALLFTLFYMFASSSALSSFRKKQKLETEKVLSKAGPRDYVQALANLGVATICIVAYKFLAHPVWMIAAIGSVAASNADSWASEIGSLSKKNPVSIINFQALPRGVSGGISLLGTIAGFAGSVFIVTASMLTIQLLEPVKLNIWPFVVSASIAGFLSMLFDSWMGALFQALYKDSRNSGLTENSDGNRLVKGYGWINNDMVNFFSTLFGGLCSSLIYVMIVWI